MKSISKKQVEVLIAANRFGLGAKPGELAHVATGPQEWLTDQLRQTSRKSPYLIDLPTTAEMLEQVADVRRADSREISMSDAAETTTKKTAEVAGAVPDQKAIGKILHENYVTQVSARYREAAATELPFIERLTHFWSNHFAVSVDKPPQNILATLFENEAIRPNVTGRFSDLLIAATKHPAMLLYLDNGKSVGPNSARAQSRRKAKGARPMGLNENLSREILELHTLGVDGGYSQTDVTNLANILTGWSVGGIDDGGDFSTGETGRFEYRDTFHEPGTHDVLGKSFPEAGLQQGEAVLAYIANHPATARHVSTKLAIHFEADSPSTRLIDKLVDAFLSSGGSLQKVYEELISTHECWDNVRSKLKTPHDFVVSTMRAYGYVPDDVRPFIGALVAMGQKPFDPGSPEGWPDKATAWGGSDAIVKRIEWSKLVANSSWAVASPDVVSTNALGASMSARTRKIVFAAGSRTQATTLLLASPEFQRR